MPDGRITLRDAAGREWNVLNVPLDPGWAGALAAVGTDWRWQGWRWEERSRQGQAEARCPATGVNYRLAGDQVRRIEE